MRLLVNHEETSTGRFIDDEKSIHYLSSKAIDSTGAGAWDGRLGDEVMRKVVFTILSLCLMGINAQANTVLVPTINGTFSLEGDIPSPVTLLFVLHITAFDPLPTLSGPNGTINIDEQVRALATNNSGSQQSTLSDGAMYLTLATPNFPNFDHLLNFPDETLMATDQDRTITVTSGVSFFAFSSSINFSIPSITYDITVDLPEGLTIAAPVPELSIWAMLLIGFAGIGFAGYRRKHNGSGVLRLISASLQWSPFSRCFA